MEFVTPWMLLGIAAIAIPILIHLMNRRSAKTVDWGAFYFLRDSILKRRTRVLIEEMLLLACRCLLVSLLALAIARPFIQPGSRVPWAVVLPMLLFAVSLLGVSFAMWRYPKWRWRLVAAGLLLGLLASAAIVLERELQLARFGRGAQRDVILILDGSSSMTILRDGSTNFERARAEAENYIKSAERGTAFGLMIGGPVPQALTPAPLTDRRELYRLLDTVTPMQGTMDIYATLSGAAMLLASGNNPVKQIVILGDGQTAGWHLNAPERWRVLAAIFGQFLTKPQVIWRTFPLSKSLRNVAIDELALSSDVIGTDRDTVFTVTVRNTGTEPVTPEDVRLTVEGRTFAARNVGQIESGDARTLTFRHRFTTPGTHVATAALDAGDDLVSDDSSTRVVHVLDSLRVLLVEGNPVGTRFDRTTAYLTLALCPGTTNAASFLMQPEVIDSPLLTRKADFSPYAVVILSDLPRIPESAAAALAQFVINGGGLWILPGVRTQKESYNAWTAAAESLLPLPLVSQIVVTNDLQRPSLATASFTHDVLRALQNTSDLGRVQPAQYWRLDDAVAPERVAARLNNNAPFLAMRKLGRGTVALSAITFDAALSSLPSRTAFLPFIHLVTGYLARPSSANLNLAPCDGATVFLTPGSRKDETVAVGATLSDGSDFQANLTCGAEGVCLRIARTLTPGLYSFRIPATHTNLLATLVGTNGILPLCVSPGIAESDLSTVTQPQIDAIRGQIDLRTATEEAQVQKALLGESFGKEIWRTLALAALFLLFLEIVLTRWIAIQRRTGANETVSFS